VVAVCVGVSVEIEMMVTVEATGKVVQELLWLDVDDDVAAAELVLLDRDDEELLDVVDAVEELDVDVASAYGDGATVTV
jgi:hypothetical protein